MSTSTKRTDNQINLDKDPIKEETDHFFDSWWEEDFLPLSNIIPEEQNILIVDDDPTILTLLKEYIATLGFNLVTASNGINALSELKNSEFSIVITDLLMPGMDGMELIKEVKRNWPDTDIIVITGYTNSYRYTDVIRAGASDFIQKPFNLDELEAKINRLLKERKLRYLLRKLSIRDPLTNLYNRHFFERKFTEEAKRAARQSYPFFLVLIDVDRFKFYNKEKGTKAGDKLLKAIAKIIKNCTRRHVDSTFRYGGDEFAILIPQTDTPQVIKIVERIRAALKKELPDVGFSIGIAKFIRREDRALEKDLEDLINRAQEAVYQAKDAGGDQAVLNNEDGSSSKQS